MFSMKKATTLLLIPAALAIAVIVFHSTLSSGTSPLVIAHVTVIDVSGGPALSDRTVIIEGDKIVCVGNAPEMALPTGARIFDGREKYLIPGLWDMHAHISHEEIYFPLLIAHGITGVREMGNDFELIRSWRKAESQGRLVGPRIFAAGPIIDGPDIRIQKMRVNVGTEREARRAVDRLNGLGVDFIKVWSMLSREAYFGVAAEAKKLNLTFVGHVPLAVTAQEASVAGQKSIEHLANILLGCSTQESRLMRERSDFVIPGTSEAALRFLEMFFYKQSKDIVDTFDPAKAAVLFQDFRRNGTWVCPTLSLWRPYAFMDDPKMTNDPRLKYVPKEWNPEQIWFLKDQTASDLGQVKRVFKKDLEIVGAMHRAGVSFLAGTDAPNIHLFPGFALHDELALLVEAGFTPLEALQTATINPAEFLGTLDSMGTVEKGKFADLVLLDADPSADIRNVEKIRAVIMNGRFLDRKYLDELLEKAAHRTGP
jgi:hypothetical protein